MHFLIMRGNFNFRLLKFTILNINFYSAKRVSSDTLLSYDSCTNSRAYYPGCTPAVCPLVPNLFGEFWLEPPLPIFFINIFFFITIMMKLHDVRIYMYNDILSVYELRLKYGMLIPCTTLLRWYVPLNVLSIYIRHYTTLALSILLAHVLFNYILNEYAICVFFFHPRSFSVFFDERCPTIHHQSVTKKNYTYNLC